MQIRFKQIFFISNILSLLRILLIAPLIIFFENKNYIITISISLIILLTDFFDGFLARELNQITDLGKVLDPFADKIATISIVIYLFLKGKVPLWLIITLISRDIIIFIGGLIIKRIKDIVVQSNIWGKMTTGFLALYFLSLILSFIVSIEKIVLILLIISLIFLVISTTSYFIIFIKILRGKNETN